MGPKQKLNMESSTTADLVAVRQLLPLVMWVPSFLEEQEHPTKTNYIYQDNDSVMLSEKNGKASSGEQMRKTNMQHFMATDAAKKGQLDLVHCPTDKVIRGYFTKALQGAKFSLFQKI